MIVGGVRYDVIEDYPPAPGGLRVRRLRASDGQVVTATRPRGGRWSIVGTRDETAGKPRLDGGRAPAGRFGR